LKIASTLIVGAGGIGTHIAEPLARMLWNHDNAGFSIRIVDGDVYEEKNSARQMFNAEFIGISKSAALRMRIEGALGLRHSERANLIESEHGYVASSEDAAGLMLRTTKQNPVEEEVKGGALLVCLCVDNDATRRLFYDAIELLPIDHPTIIVIDCGNDLETSTVVASIWHQRKSQLANPVEVYANLKDPKDRVPGGGCLDMAPSTPQLMLANMSAAFGALMMVQAMLDGAGWTDVVMSNIRKFSVGIAGGEYGF